MALMEVCDVCGDMVNTKALKTLRVIVKDQGRRRTMNIRVCERCRRLQRLGGRYYICQDIRRRR